MRWSYGLAGKTQTAKASVKLATSPRIGYIDCAKAAVPEIETVSPAARKRCCKVIAFLPAYSQRTVTVTW
jgi:hypothetical protein